MTIMAEQEYLDIAGVAAAIGVKYTTMRVYVAKANVRRREGQSRPGDIPPPDAVFGQSPVWKPSTIEQWRAHRPGKGVGGAEARELKRQLEKYRQPLDSD